MTARIVLAIAAIIVGVSNWVAAVEHAGDDPGAIAEPREIEPLTLTGPDANARRLQLLDQAALYLEAAGATPDAAAVGSGADGVASCRFVHDKPSGTSAKFTCMLENGEIVKVKYGRNPEVHGEVAATRLLRMLGYPSDSVTMVPRLRCYACPRYPFAGSYVMANPVTRHLLARHDGYSEFEWVSVERKYPARPIETEEAEGWNWWELAEVSRDAAPERRADVDALTLLAAFLAHWDNKAENQRLVCLDENPDGDCGRPLAMIHDLGATFGPMKVNLARWRDVPIWHDRATCTVSMRSLPYEGASFKDAVISEAGRAQLAARLGTMSDADVRELFSYARFPEQQSATDDEKSLEAWTETFRHRANQIVNARCP